MIDWGPIMPRSNFLRLLNSVMYRNFGKKVMGNENFLPFSVSSKPEKADQLTNFLQEATEKDSMQNLELSSERGFTEGAAFIFAI